MKRVIRLGDPTTHGGQVVSAAGNVSVCGRNVARLGDQVTCPRSGHGVATIIEGDPGWLIDGIPVALEGHKTSCGASLISTLPNLGRGA
ncbi:MAG: PAAR domain-containing protein [Zoogloea sp.]|nr:PAAR domain-containing protein [Zoogloea sp.]